MLLINKQKASTNICYLIDVSPKQFIGGGQSHLMNMVHQMQVQSSVFGGPRPNFFMRLSWMFLVIPQVIFHHNFRQRFDLIHAHSIPAMASGKILSFLLKIPLVATVHGAWMKNKIEQFVLTQIKYDAQITVSRDFLEYENINKNIVYIPNGVNIAAFKGSALSRQGRALSSRRTVLFVGRKSDPAKGFRILDQAIKAVKKEISNIELIIAGGDIPHATLVNLYKRADLFVLPSLSEGFPLTLLEAWAAKVPAVATAVGDIPYIFIGSLRNFQRMEPRNRPEVYETSRGYLVNPGSVTALAKAIVMAFENPDLAKLGENGYNLAKGYSWKKVAQKTQVVYQRICSTSWRAPMTKRWLKK